MNDRELAMCYGKHAFDNRALAMMAAKRKRGRHAYRCKVCHLWHVGNERKRMGRPCR